MNIKKILQQSVIIIVWSAIIGLVYNQFSEAKISLIRTETPEIVSKAPSNPNYQRLSENQQGSHSLEGRDLSIDEAYTLFKTKNAIFMDGRSERNYNNSHIKGATSIYFRTAATNPNLKNIGKDQLIVTYCINARCPIAHNLARELIKLGFTNVYVFPGGIEEWTKAKYPLEGV